MKLLKEDVEKKNIYTVSVTYAASINVEVPADTEEEAIQLAESGTGISPGWEEDLFTVDSEYDIHSLDYGETPIIKTIILDSKVNPKSIEIKPLTTSLGYLALATDLSKEEIIQIIEDESYYDNEKLDREIQKIITNEYDGELSAYDVKLDGDKVIIYDIELEEDSY